MIKKHFRYIFKNLSGLQLRKTTILYIAMLLNVVLGYVITKINTKYLSLAEFGMYSLFMNTILFSRAFFSFGVYETTAKIENFMVQI
jgi:O-antigen/teichoic acid export membrane protein